jgi:hypothetical protein
VNTPAAMAGEDIEVTELESEFSLCEGKGRNLVTRRLSRGVVADCFAKSTVRSNYAIVGSAGVGKTWTLIYTLQQALLYNNACVVLCCRNSPDLLACIRRNDKVYVWNLSSREVTSILLENSHVLYLLDPTESSRDGDYFSEGRRMLVMTAYNDAKFFEGMENVTPDYARILSMYSNSELETALPYMIAGQEDASTVEQMLKRATKVGNLPREIYSNAWFSRRKESSLELTQRIIDATDWLLDEIVQFDGLFEGNTIVF